MSAVAEIDPKAVAELERNLADPMWRLSNLYKILIKGDDEADGGEGERVVDEGEGDEGCSGCAHGGLLR